MVDTAMSPDMDTIKAKMRSTWIAGDFGEIAKIIEKGGEEFVQRLGVKQGERVLDVACGTGNLAIPAAKAGADVTGLDIAPNLVEQARERAAAEGLNARFDEGDAEALPYDDGSFDTVMTMFGAMFAPRPDVTAKELIRVSRSGGRIAMANWTAEAFTGLMFKTSAKHFPPPPGIPSPVLWGDEDTVRSRLSEGIKDLQMTRRPIIFKFPFDPAGVVEHFRQFFGPTKVAFDNLAPDAQDAMRSDLEKIWIDNNRATDGSTEVESEYLEVIAIKD
jgi:SAM-dependent methyltransferase